MSVADPALRAVAGACFEAALAAVAPRPLAEAALQRQEGALALCTPRLVATHRGPVTLIAAGKAAVAMTAGAGAARARAAVLVAPHGAAGEAPPGLQVLGAAHPVPDVAGVAATARVLETVRAAGPDTLVLALLSGGASALLVAPAGDLTLDDKRDVTAALLVAGADITALNTVRKHCSRVKGGGLARAAGGAAGLWTLLLSDVVGDDPATIASGPTVADPTTYADALAVLDRWLAPDAVPPRVRAHLEAGCAGRQPETLKPGDPALARVVVHLLAGNRTAVRAAAATAQRLGFATDVVAAPLAGDAAAAGRCIVDRLAAAPRDRPVAIVAGGETTVRVVAGGRGGRSQHLALAAAVALAGLPGVVLAAGTDGVDGPTDAAGACVDGDTVSRARARGHDAVTALAATDSHPVLDAAGDLLRTGATGTNVADLVVALRAAC